MGSINSFMILCWWAYNLVAFDLIAAKVGRSDCIPSSCGHIHNISYPFRLKQDPQNCGKSAYTLSCENNVTILDLSARKFYVQAINYSSNKIWVVDASVQNNNGSSIPSYSLTNLDIDPYYVDDYWSSTDTASLGCILPQNKSAGSRCRGTYSIYFLKCKNPVNSSVYVDTSPCFKSQPNSHDYVKVNGMEVGELKDGCNVERISFVYLSDDWDASCTYIQTALLYGFEMTYYDSNVGCGRQWSINYKCYPKSFTGCLHLDQGFFRFLWVEISDFFAYGDLAHAYTRRHQLIFFADTGRHQLDLRIASVIGIGLIFLARLILGAPLVIAFFIYKWRRRHLSMYNTIEEFLHGENNFVPIRYSYLDIKRMSNKFKDKLGEGGYGCVFKAKLRSGRYGAIKMLDKPRANGEEFISEVATIGRIHHVNVVQLIGYCVEGSKCALVYDFMPNGSLDKYIYSKEGSNPLSYKQMYEISLGVAQGIEYLHQGCDMQILHFDIKPHNILLDQNFIPKVSDFGLAKLYPTDDSIVSLTAARGTMGYIAPELFYKNIGGVSYKADVYSFGMLLMEMASKRKNFKESAGHASQTYFPSWVYDQYEKGKDLEMGDVTAEEKKMVKKMVITALWCIQMNPSDRPSMKKVTEMLEGDVELLQMPSNPFKCSEEIPLAYLQNNIDPICSNAELTWTLSARE